MGTIGNLIEKTEKEDRNFVGTISFKSEEITLPDGSLVALGIDCEKWVIVYQKDKSSPFIVYEYDNHNKNIYVDKKIGDKNDVQKMKKIVDYFFTHAYSEDLVTIGPEGG